MRIPSKEREEFVAFVVSARGFATQGEAVDLAREAMRLACASQRWAETECSRYIGDGEKKRGDAYNAKRDARMAEIATYLGMTLEVQGDPRGAIYRLGGRAVPSVGWSVREIDMIASRCESRAAAAAARPEGKEVRS